MRIVKIASMNGSLGKEGCEKAPDKIIENLKDIWLNEDFKKLEYSVDSVSIVRDDIQKTNENIFFKVQNLNEKCIFIGGDHSVSYAIISGLAEKHKNLGVIVFDAHPDCYELFEFVTHEDWLRKLIEAGIIKKENVIIVGIRNPDKKEIDYLNENKIKYFTVKKIFNNVEEIADIITELCREFNSLYVSIDIDVLDPSCAPGTGYLEPGGLSVRELLYLLQRLKVLKNIGGVDIVEVNPNFDINGVTSKVAAKLIGEFL